MGCNKTGGDGLKNFKNNNNLGGRLLGTRVYLNKSADESCCFV